MKKILLMIMAAFVALGVSARMPNVNDVKVKDINVARDGSRLNLNFNLDLEDLPVSRNVETRLTPMIIAGNDSLLLESVTVAGKARWLQAKRNGYLEQEDNKYIRGGKVTTLPYSASVAYEPWMQDARIDLVVENKGCCRSRKTIGETGLAQLNLGDRSFDVPLQYVVPSEELIKTRNAKGEAYIDFMVNKTNILPTYRNNPSELAKIRSTIDSVKNDPDYKITSIAIKGFASPEGSYSNNERLAKGRTIALSDYVRNLYSFPKDLLSTSWEAEDWAGLRNYVAKSEISAKDAILAIIDSDLAPDAKDSKLKKDFPVDYSYMLQNWYPALRHSDYTIEFTVRSYSDPADIARIMKTAPSKLSLREFFILAQTLEPQSAEYADVFDTAVRMYPLDPVANLNAANIAISRGHLQEAAAYLEKAGDSPEAEYARGVIAAKNGDYLLAQDLFNKAATGGIDVSAAVQALNTVQDPPVKILTDE